MLETVQNTYFLSLIKILKVAGEKQPDSRRKRSQMTSLEKCRFLRFNSGLKADYGKKKKKTIME